MIADIADHIDRLRRAGSLRKLRPLSGKNGCRVGYNGASLLNMTSNDYLGIAGDAGLHCQFYSALTGENALENYGLGSASSRLLTGDSNLAHQLETTIAKNYGRSACLLFNSGYHANIGILPALTNKQDLVVADKLNHASLIDGLRLSRASYKRFRHLDYDHLKTILENDRERYRRVVIVTESVFSMDGDEADLNILVKLKKEFDCMLYVDEAHSVGVYGATGLGKAEESEVIGDIDFLIGTFGKAFASVGAFLVCNDDIRDYLINFSRSLLFTTALPPVIHCWNNFVFEKVIHMEERRRHLQDLSNKLRKKLIADKIPTGGTTNIVPVFIGDNAKTAMLAEKMQDYGFLIFAIRPPTVPDGTARFRLSLTADMSWADLEGLPTLIKKKLQN